jgi:hypothetical protein
MNLASLLRPLHREPAEATAADLRAAMKDAETSKAAAAEHLAKLEASLGDILLDGDADAEAQHRAATLEAVEHVKRAEAVVEALRPRIAAADERETEVFLQGQARLAERLASEAVEHVLAYDAAARAMLAAAEKVNDASARVATMNRRMMGRGRPDLAVLPPLNRVWEHNRNERLAGLMVAGPRRAASSLAGYERAVAEAPPPPPVHPPTDAEIAAEADLAFASRVVGVVVRG